MMETAKKIFKIGIYGQIEKMTKYLEDRYNVTNGWLNFQYTVGEFPKQFKKTCLYLGLKENTVIFAVNSSVIGGNKALVVISPPNCNSNWSVLTEINWWMYPNLSYWAVEELKNTTKEKIQTDIENCFRHLQDFCNFIDLFGKHLQNVPRFTEIASDNNLSTQGE